MPHESLRVVLHVNILFIDKIFKLCLYFIITSLVLFITIRKDSLGSEGILTKHNFRLALAFEQ